MVLVWESLGILIYTEKFLIQSVVFLTLEAIPVMTLEVGHTA